MQPPFQALCNASRTQPWIDWGRRCQELSCSSKNWVFCDDLSVGCDNGAALTCIYAAFSRAASDRTLAVASSGISCSPTTVFGTYPINSYFSFSPRPISHLTTGLLNRGPWTPSTFLFHFIFREMRIWYQLIFLRILVSFHVAIT